MNTMISIIIPVYKVEKYLDKCIKSIVSQTYSNLEIVLVDDGSPDKSGLICDKWATLDSRIRVVHQKNAGAGAARNVALKLAQGEFISFVDSDDYLSVNMFKNLLSYFEEDIDIVECEFISVEEDDVLFIDEKSVQARVFSSEEAMREHIADHYFRQLIWNKLYRRSCIKNVYFPEGKKIDDEFWMYKVIGRAKQLVHCNEKLYAYRQQDNSVMHMLKPENRIQAIEAKGYRHQYIKEKFPRLTLMSYDCLVMSCIYQIQRVYRTGTKDDVQKVLEYSKKVLRENEFKKRKFRGIHEKQEIWVSMAEISLAFTCRIRNLLKIGL